MLNFILIFICLASGYMIRRSGLIPGGGHKGLNLWILYMALPACFLRYLPSVQWSKEVLLPCLAPVLVWVGAWMLVTFYSYKRNLSKKSRGALKLTAGLSNTAFLGFIAVYYSEKEIEIAVLYDQSSFILMSTFGLVTAIREAGCKKPGFPEVARKLFSFPPFIACLLALVLPVFVNISYLNPLFDKVVATLGPVALFCIGLQLEFSLLKKERKSLAIGLVYKLLIAPLLILILMLAIGQKGSVAQISIFEAGMPTLAMASVLADEYDLNPPLANLIVGISMILSLVTMGFWWWILEHIR